MALLKFEYKNYLDKSFQSLVYLFLQVGWLRIGVTVRRFPIGNSCYQQVSRLPSSFFFDF